MQIIIMGVKSRKAQVNELFQKVQKRCKTRNGRVEDRLII